MGVNANAWDGPRSIQYVQYSCVNHVVMIIARLSDLARYTAWHVGTAYRCTQLKAVRTC